MSTATIQRLRFPRYPKRLYFREVWKPVPKTKSIYEISSEGRLRSLDRWVFCKNGRMLFRKGRILKCSTENPKKYEVACLSLDSGKVFWYIHRLVARVFIGICPPGMECCHK